ncbi:MAG: hypothetical protein II806_04795 [Bacteroidaceae bacterium]|nr:hypothetical protein [Bacteroidaceae bacterium]
MKNLIFILLFLPRVAFCQVDGYTGASEQSTEKIDRKAVLKRNNPKVTAVDTLASLSVGNGRFATTVDVTGMQSFPEVYKNGVPLCAMSEWGWHSFPNTENLKAEESRQTVRFPFRDHDEVYAVEYKRGGRQQAATTYFRVNPHRLNLGTIGLSYVDETGRKWTPADITDINQELKLQTGTIESQFKVGGERVEVTTACMPDRAAMIYNVKSPLLKSGQLMVTVRFSYPTGKHADDANDWTKADRHRSKIVMTSPRSAVIERTIDNTTYYLILRWEGNATFEETGKHQFVLKSKEGKLSFEAEYKTPSNFKSSLNREDLGGSLDLGGSFAAVENYWKKFWHSSGFVDFSACSDSRAKELERRVVLSQYLTQINCAGGMPPQETGLTYNSGFGRPHLEMTWWHAVHFALWGRSDVLGNMMKWYNDVAAVEARKIAERQGFKGVRWMKMTDPWAGEAPSNTGSFLIWQQPHYIYMAEDMYRANPTKQTLEQYAELVEQTAAWMADFVVKDSVSGTYQLRGATAMQETMTKANSYNHPFELAYWRYGLLTAQQWRERQGQKRCAEWDEIIGKLSPLPMENDVYVAGSAYKEPTKQVTAEQDEWGLGAAGLELKSRSDHPAVLGACGLIPSGANYPMYNQEVMRKTLQWVLQNWNWNTTWGWDYGMTAMAAARLGERQTAVDMLLTDKVKNRYLVSGHNFQTADRLRLYLPGNGSLLTAVAMMCAGWEGCPNVSNPGFPQDGKWNVRWEGLRKMQ